MSWDVPIENLEVQEVRKAAYICIDTRFPKQVTLSNSAWSNSPQDEYLRIKEDKVIDVITDICLRIIDIRPTVPLIRNNGVWTKYIRFFRISENEFTVLDRHNDAIFSISDLEIDFKNYTV